MQMYLCNSGTQGITADAPSGTSIEKVEMDYNGMRSVIMIQIWNKEHENRYVIKDSSEFSIAMSLNRMKTIGHTQPYVCSVISIHMMI